MTSKKIISLENIAIKSHEAQNLGMKIVLCHGTFDLMHTGHIRYLNSAKKEGDLLLVTLTGDKFVNKGPDRPVFNERLRAENLAALECVDYVAVIYSTTAVEALQAIKPNIYAKGSEYRYLDDDITGNILHEKNAVEAHGGVIIFTDEITFSSSNLLNEHFDVFAPKTRDYLERFKRLWSAKDVSNKVNELADLNVLVIGDAIIDQYYYVSVLGQTGKGNALAVQYENEEQFAGGSIALANHVACFAKKVSLVTALGNKESHESFIRQKLQPNINPQFYRFINAPTVTKRRFVDSDLSKLFEIYYFNDEPELEAGQEQLSKWLVENVGNYDAVVVPDFGNGFISNETINILCNKSKFLAVNTQINSGNRGYHVINRYKRADFASLNEPELRLAAHNRHDRLETVSLDVAKRVKAKHIAVTRGTNGLMMFDIKDNRSYEIPALSSRVVDRIGAGDAFLSLSALCLAKDFDAELAAFIGSVAAAMDVQIVCNRDPINPVSLKKYISTLLK